MKVINKKMNMKKNYIVPETKVDGTIVSDDLLQASAPDVNVNPDADPVTEVDAREGSYQYRSVWDE